jgi:hypothetical protein
MVVRSFQFTWFRSVTLVGPVLEMAAGDWSAQPLVKQQEQDGDALTLVGQSIGVAAGFSFQQPVCPLSLRRS